MKRRNWIKLVAIAVIACTATVFAQGTNAPAATPVKGNPDSKIYHLPSCRHYTAKGTTKVFKSVAEAKEAGYKPCKKCAVPKKDKKGKPEKKDTEAAEAAE